MYIQSKINEKWGGTMKKINFFLGLNRFKPMKNYLLILGIISIFLISACSQQPEPVPTAPQPSIITPAPEQVVVETKPSIAVEEQKVENDNVVVTRLFLDKSGYVVIHKVADGKPGAVIGNSELLDGENSNVNVKVSDYENENELIAMLHYDDGDGNYEFPGDDTPTKVDDKVVLQKFILLETTLTQGPVQIEAPAPTSDVVEIDMTAKQWEFTPATITVNEGDKVKLNIQSVDVTHGFSLSEFGVSERLTPGKTTIVEFTADKVGEYIFFCTVPCGRGHSGMRGKLVVE